jgi:hypothetical protein
VLSAVLRRLSFPLKRRKPASGKKAAAGWFHFRDCIVFLGGVSLQPD